MTRKPQPAPAARPALRRHAVLLALAAVVAAGCERPRESRLTDQALTELPLPARAAQLVVARAAVPPARDTLARAALRRLVAETGVGGVLLTGGDARAAAALLDSLRGEAPLPLLVALDADRGAGAVLGGAAEAPPPAALGLAAGIDAAREAGAAVGEELRALGVDLALVSGPPVSPGASLVPADPRAPAAVDATAAYAAALRETGVSVAVRAFLPSPGEREVPTFRWDRAALEAVALGWLRGVLAEGTEAVALAPVILPSLTGDSIPLPLGPVPVAGLLRRDLDYGGAVVVELGPESPLTRLLGEREAAVRVVAAGADLLVGVEDARGTAEALAAAVRSGRLPASRVEAAVQRVFALKRRTERTGPDGEGEGGDRPAAPLPRPATATAARAAHARAVLRLGGPAAALRGCPSVAVVATSRAGAPLVAEALARARSGVAVVLADTVALRGPVVRDTAGVRVSPRCLLLEHRPGPVPVVVDRLFAPDTARAPGDTTRRPAAAADTLPRRVIEVGFLSNRVVSPRPAAAVLAWGLGAGARSAAVEALLGRGTTGEAPLPPVAFPAARVLREVPAESVGMSSTALARVDEAIRGALAEGLAPGAAVAIGRRGGLVRLRGYGRTSPGGGTVDARATLYDIASLSKVAGTTAAAMTLVEEGRLRLDAPVRRYLPEFRGPGKGAVTVRHLLTHTGGLPAGAWLYSSASAEPALDRVMRAELEYTPGTRAVYSDFGMILLAEIVRRQAEEPLDVYLARRVFAPLGMQSTMYRPPVWLHPQTAPAALRSERPYPVRGAVHDGNAFRLEGVTGHAGLFSTAADLAVYSQLLLNRGAYGPRRLWSPALVQRFTANQGLPGGRALGWDRPAPRSSAGDFLSARSYGHTGFTGTSLWIDPERDLFVVLLTNRTYDNASQGAMLALRMRVAEAAARAIADLPIPPRPGTATAIEQERQRRVEEQRRRRRIEEQRRRQRERQRPRRPRRPAGRSGRG